MPRMLVVAAHPRLICAWNIPMFRSTGERRITGSAGTKTGPHAVDWNVNDVPSDRRTRSMRLPTGHLEHRDVPPVPRHRWRTCAYRARHERAWPTARSDTDRRLGSGRVHAHAGSGTGRNLGGVPSLRFRGQPIRERVPRQRATIPGPISSSAAVPRQSIDERDAGARRDRRGHRRRREPRTPGAPTARISRLAQPPTAVPASLTLRMSRPYPRPHLAPRPVCRSAGGVRRSRGEER